MPWCALADGDRTLGIRERKKAATREALIDAAARLFNERGVEATTMEDIAALAGTSRTSVFNYFGYKEALLVEIGARYVREIAERVAPRRARSPRGVMRDLADAIAELVSEEPVLAKAVAREMVHPDPERRRYAAERMGYPVLYRGLLTGLASKGRLRHPKQLQTYERQLVDLTSGAIVRVGGDYPPAQLRAEFYRNIDLFCDGALIPTTGREQ